MLGIAAYTVNLVGNPACIEWPFFVESRAQLIPTCAPCYRVARELPLEPGG